MKCDDCLNSRKILSENGYHTVCCLSEKEFVKCLCKEKDNFVSIDNLSTATLNMPQPVVDTHVHNTTAQPTEE